MANKVIWHEITGKDADKLQRFYAELFGWKHKDTPGMNYGMTDPEATGIGGAVGSVPGSPSWSTIDVSDDDVEKALAQSQRLGGKVLTPVTKLPDVTFAVFSDPEGHPIGLAQHKG